MEPASVAPRGLQINVVLPGVDPLCHAAGLCRPLSRDSRGRRTPGFSTMTPPRTRCGRVRADSTAPALPFPQESRAPRGRAPMALGPNARGDALRPRGRCPTWGVVWKCRLPFFGSGLRPSRLATGRTRQEVQVVLPKGEAVIGFYCRGQGLCPLRGSKAVFVPFTLESGELSASPTPRNGCRKKFRHPFSLSG